MPSKSRRSSKSLAREAEPSKSKDTFSHEMLETRFVGGSISKYPVEFTSDSKFFFVCSEKYINVCSITTGAVVKILSSHTDTVVGVKLNPKNTLQLYSASKDGTIKLWDYNDGTVLKTYTVGRPIHRLAMSSIMSDYVYIVTEDDGASTYSACQFNLGHQDSEQPVCRTIVSMPRIRAITVSPAGNLVAIGGGKQLEIWPVMIGTDDVSPEQRISISTHFKVTALAFNPVGERSSLAVGDSLGRITLYYNCFETGSAHKAETVSMHWHEGEVRTLTFMVDGIHLMSGGNESVVVIWQLETSHKQFLPRLGGAIESIGVSPDYKYYCVGLDDNTFQIIRHVKQSIERTVYGLQCDGAMATRTPMVTNPQTQHVALDAGNGAIQFYDIYGNKHTMMLQVAQRIQVRERATKIDQPRAAHMAFSSNGEWMATVDRRNENDDSTSETNLKFWQWDPNTQTYSMHTRVENPHGKSITDLTFNPSKGQKGLMVITTSEDGCFRVWCLQTNEDSSSWVCRSAGDYRGSIPHCAAISDDGSVLAVAFGRTITLWDPNMNRLRFVLNHPMDGTVQQLGFLHHTPYLVAISRLKNGSLIQVWNLLNSNQRDWWSCRTDDPNPCLAIEPGHSGRFAVICRSPDSLDEGSRVVIFEGASAIPHILHKLPIRVLAATFVVDNEGHSELVCLGPDRRLSVLSTKSKENSAMANGKASLTTKSRAILDQVFGRQEQVKRERPSQTFSAEPHHPRSTSHNPSVLDAPAHTLPSVDQLFDTFMSTLNALRLDADGTTAVASPSDTDIMAVDDDHVRHQPSRSDLQTWDRMPSLDTYFASAQSTNDTYKSNMHATSSSSQQQDMSDDDHDDTDEDEDPSQIDW